MGFALLVASLLTQSGGRPVEAALLNHSVFASCDETAPTAVPADVQRRLAEVARRCAAFTPRVRSLPGLTNGEREMVDTARQGYERLLWTMARGSSTKTARLAAAYVEALRPCYEWEGYHDCPEREAVFADTYLKEHRASPFAEFLPLLAAHRWQCAAEAYEYEARNHVRDIRGSVGIAETRRRASVDLAAALGSADPLVRAGAELLKRTGSCL